MTHPTGTGIIILLLAPVVKTIRVRASDENYCHFIQVEFCFFVFFIEQHDSDVEYIFHVIVN